MTIPNITNFNALGELIIQKYERYLPTAFDDSLTILEKVNKVIEYLNSTGKLVNDVVEQWNQVMEYIFNEGLSVSVNNKLDEMAVDGTLEQIINIDIIGGLSDLTTINKTNLVAGINEVNQEIINARNGEVDLNTRINAVNTQLEENYVNINSFGVLSDLTTINKSNLVAGINEVNQEIITARNGEVDLNTRINAVNTQLEEIYVNINSFGGVGDGDFDNKTILQSMIDSNIKNIFISDGVYLIDNSISPILINKDNVRITGNGILKATSEFNDLIKVVGKNFEVKNITIEGNGNIIENQESEERTALLKLDGSTLSSMLNAKIENVKFKNPSVTSINTYKAVGITIINNNFFSVRNKNNLSSPYTMHIAISGTAIFLIEGNVVDGMAQGIAGSGLIDGQEFDDFSGEVAFETRKGIIKNNTVVNQYDHGIYFSDHTKDYKVETNNVYNVNNEGIKVEDINIELLSNHSENGIACRNTNNITIDNNDIVCLKSNAYIYGILIGDSAFKRPLNNIKISNNRIKHLGEISKSGIMVQGLYLDGYQWLISNLSIINNLIEGFGNSNEGSGITINQQMAKDVATNEVVGNIAKNISILNNQILMNDGGGLTTYGVNLIGGGFEDIVVNSNLVKNFTSIGLRLLGVKKITTNNNSFIASSLGPATKYGIHERNNDLLTHINSEQNSYGNDLFSGLSADVIWANESSRSINKKAITYSGNANRNVGAHYNANRIFNTVTSAGYKIILGGIFTVGDVIEIYNMGTVAFTIDPAGFTLNGGEMAVAYYQGNGVFTYFKK